MSTYVLIPGAGGAGWYWHLVVPRLREAGHEASAVDLLGDNETAGLREYTEQVVVAIGDRDDVVLVAQSLGGLTVPLVAAKVSVRALVLVNAMIPTPGETPGAWWDNTGWLQAREAAAERGGYPAEFDLAVYFSTTSRPRSPPPASPTSAPRPTRRSSRSATSRPGRRSRSASLPEPTTASFRSSSSSGWRRSGSASRPTFFPAVTCSPCRSRTHSRPTCFATDLPHDATAARPDLRLTAPYRSETVAAKWPSPSRRRGWALSRTREEPDQ